MHDLDKFQLGKLLADIQSFKQTRLYELFNTNKEFIVGTLNNSIIEALTGDELMKATGEQSAELRNWTFFEELEQNLIVLINEKQKGTNNE